MTDTSGLAFALGSVAVVLAIALYVWTAIALAAVFRKSGEEPWKAWVPVYNGMTLLWLGGLSGWLLLVLFVPIVGTLAAWVLIVIACHRVNVAFGRGPGMTVFAALLFPVWATVLGFGPDRWVARRPLDDSRSLSPVFPTGAATGPGGVVGPTGPTRHTYAAPGSARSRSGEPAPESSEPSWVRPAPPIPPTVVDPEIAGSRPAATRSQNPIPPVPRASAAEAAQVHGPWQPASDSPPLPDPAAPSAPAVAPLPSAPTPSSADMAPAAGAPLDDAAPRSAAQHPATSPSEGAFRSFESEHRPARTNPVEAGAGLRRSARSAPLPGSDEDLWAMFDYEPSLGATGEVTGGVPDAPGPISAIPGVSASSSAPPPAAPPVTRVPRAPEVPTRDPWAPTDSDAFGESGEVSAIAGAPDAGSPRAARSSVSAQHPEAEIPEEPIEETIIARRRRTTWTLQMPTGRSVPLTSDVVLLGRRPSSDPQFPDAQLIPIDEPTVSKTHARLELRDEQWIVVDLDSTNGVVLVTEAGAEIDVVPGVESIAGSRILLGDADLRLVRTDG